MRTFLFTRPRGNSLYFLHGELLCQGGEFAFPLVASSPTVFSSFGQHTRLAFQELQRSLPRELRCFRIVAVTRIVEERVIGPGGRCSTETTCLPNSSSFWSRSHYP